MVRTRASALDIIWLPPQTCRGVCFSRGKALDNRNVAQVFAHIAGLLELKGENPFKIRAYTRAAETFAHLETPLTQILEEGRLRTIPGVGQAICAKTEELLTTGRLGFYEKLKAEFPAGIQELTQVPELGPGIAYRLIHELGIPSIEALEQALADGRVATMPRMGEKSAAALKRSVQTYREKQAMAPADHG